MRNILLLGAAAAALVAPMAAMAQETTSAIRGTVSAGGQPVAGATVVAVNVPSGTRSETTTDARGSFSFSGLRVGGPYSVTVTSPQGNTTVTDIFTVVQQDYTLPIELADASAGPDIVVTASSIAGAGVTSDGPQTVLTADDIAKVASVNRDVRDIVRRDPFATLDLTNQGERGGAISIAGVNPRYNRFTINGVQVGDDFGLNQDASPTNRGPVPFDALAQVSVSVAPYDFRQGNFQGGAIDTVLLSGTNEFHGTGFYSQSRDELQGKKSEGNTYVIPNYLSETYGATLRGPIIADKLFFMVSAERNTDPRPFATQVGQIPNLTAAQIASVTGTATGTYGYNPGPILVINNRKDEKIVGRIDWNITTGQRFSLSYINSYDTLDSQNNTSVTVAAPSYGLTSNAYALSELMRAGIVQLNSDWTDNFSTEARGIYKWYRRGQEPLLGRGFAQFRVCTDAATQGTLTTCAPAAGTTATALPIIAFGPDNSRQTNELFFDTWGGSLLARLRMNSHELKFLAELNEKRTFNNFLQNSLGNYYFDSLADYQNRRASTLQVAVPLNGAVDGAAADFHYDQWTFGIQDDWQVSDDLQVSYGFRWDLWGMRDTPASNTFFLGREGFRNTKTYKGLEIFQPRVSFNWKPAFVPGLKLRGGGGIFGGGSPDIFLSNSFSNTILSNTVTFTRAAAATAAGQATTATCTGGVPNDVCTAALNNVTGQIPAAVSTYVRSAASASATNTGLLDPNFRLPSSYKATLSADYDLFGINFGADYYFSAAKDQVTFVDARSVQIGVLPDGRPRYNSLIAFTDNNYDIMTTNTGKGRTHIGVVRADKRFDFGLQLGGSFTWQDVRDVSPATSSTINSNFQNQIFVDPNLPALGRSNDEIKWSVKYNLGFDHAFFGDYKTRIQLFGETRAGRPYSLTMNNPVGTNRSPVFGTILSGGQQLVYVPTSTTDPLVSYDTAASQSAFDTLINNSSLSKYRGKIVPKNSERSSSFTRLDLHVEQELPTGIGGSRISVFADINNLLNLIDKDWGALKQFNFPYAASVVQVQCLTAATATGQAVVAVGTTAANNPTGLPAVQAASSTQACAQYRYSNVSTVNGQPGVNDKVTNVTGSLYAIRVGARFTF